jgi:hypothetical protein
LGASPGDRRLQTHITVEGEIQMWGRRERLWQKQRGAADPLGPRMVWWQRCMSSVTETQAAGSVRMLRYGLQTCRALLMSEVARTLARKQVTNSH